MAVFFVVVEALRLPEESRDRLRRCVGYCWIIR